MEEQIAKAKTTDIAQSAQKLRLVADTIRGTSVETALDTLEFLNKKGSKIVKKTLESAIANARDLYNVDKDVLTISKISVDEAKTLKRGRYKSRGKVGKHYKRRSNLNLELKVK
jgi:large subunit ribosomal protein L22